MIFFLHLGALALYLAAAGIQIGSLVQSERLVPRTAVALLVVAMLLHAAGLGAFVAQYGELPLVGLAPSLSTLAFLIAVLLLALGTFGEARPVGIVLLPIVSALLVGALAMGIRPAGQLLAFRGWWLAFHVMLGFIGYVGLAVAFAAGLLYLLQFRELKGKRFGRIFRFFPSLATLDRLGRIGLQIGFPSLTLNLLLGWAWTIRFRQSFAFATPQVIWGIVTWFVFLAAMLAGQRGATRARRSALASVVGFAVVVAAYVILRVAITGGRLFL